MKERTLALLPLAVLLAMMLFISVTAQGTEVGVQDEPDVAAQRRAVVDPGAGERSRPNSGIQQIISSTVNFVSPVELPSGYVSQLCFNVTVSSPDAEYMDRFDVDLPDAWQVLQVMPVLETGCGSPTTEGVSPGNVVYWQIDAPIPSGCGAWCNGHYDFCAVLDVPDCAGEPWTLAWNIVGDGFGVEPHQVSGTAGPVFCLPPGLDLSPSSVGIGGCHAVPETFLLNLANRTGSDGLFAFTYEVPLGNATLSGPDGIYLGDGATQDLLVELHPSQCKPLGQIITGTVSVSGGGFHDASLLAWFIDPSGEPGCPKCNPVFAPLVLRK